MAFLSDKSKFSRGNKDNEKDSCRSPPEYGSLQVFVLTTRSKRNFKEEGQRHSLELKIMSWVILDGKSSFPHLKVLVKYGSVPRKVSIRLFSTSLI